MNGHYPPQVARYLVAVAAALAMTAGPAAADTARLHVTPQTLEVGGAETLIEVRLDGVSGLYGLDIRLEFDPALLKIIDADDAKDGVQIIPGELPAADFLVRNEADNAVGTVWYAVTQLNPREPASGSGVVCAFHARGLAAGSCEIRVVQAKLVDRSGQDLPVEAAGAEVTVSLAAAPASESSPTATPTSTPPPTASATSAPTATEEPTATSEPQEAEPTSTSEPTITPEPEDPEPTAAATPEPEPTATPVASPTPPLERVQTDAGAYPAPSATPLTVAGAAVSPSPPATPKPQATQAASASVEAPDPTATATIAPEATAQPMPLAAAHQEPGSDGGEPVAPAGSGGDGPLISPRMFAILLGLVAVAALALAVHLTRHDAEPPRDTIDRSAL